MVCCSQVIDPCQDCRSSLRALCYPTYCKSKCNIPVSILPIVRASTRASISADNASGHRHRVAFNRSLANYHSFEFALAFVVRRMYLANGFRAFSISLHLERFPSKLEELLVISEKGQIWIIVKGVTSTWVILKNFTQAHKKSLKLINRNILLQINYTSVSSFAGLSDANLVPHWCINLQQLNFEVRMQYY